MSTIVRSLMAVVLVASTAHAQSSPESVRDVERDPARLLQVPPARTRNARSEPSIHQVTTPKSPAETADWTDRYDPLPLKTGTPPRLAHPPSSRSRGAAEVSTVFVSLSVVLAAFFVLVWLSRKTAPKGLAPLPGEVFESLGRAPLTSRQQMQLIRIGNKLVLLSVTATGAETLTEITDIDEVNRLAGLCQQARPGSISDTFRQVLSQYAEEPAPGGFIGDRAIAHGQATDRAATRRGRRGEGDHG